MTGLYRSHFQLFVDIGMIVLMKVASADRAPGSLFNS